MTDESVCPTLLRRALIFFGRRFRLPIGFPPRLAGVYWEQREQGLNGPLLQ
jgi:hypothetical protein